jgi:hypothetical protein
MPSGDAQIRYWSSINTTASRPAMIRVVMGVED